MSAESIPIVVEETYPVDAAVLWKAITDPEEMRQWFFEPMEEFRAEVGFRTRFDVEAEGEVFPHVWHVTEVEPQRKLVYEWRYDGYQGDSVVHWELDTVEGGTRLKLSHYGQETFNQDNPLFSREAGIAGWTYFLQDSLKSFLAEAE